METFQILFCFVLLIAPLHEILLSRIYHTSAYVLYLYFVYKRSKNFFIPQKPLEEQWCPFENAHSRPTANKGAWGIAGAQ